MRLRQQAYEELPANMGYRTKTLPLPPGKAVTKQTDEALVNKPNTLAHPCNPSTVEVEAEDQEF